jgi:hypothetical protein
MDADFVAVQKAKITFRISCFDKMTVSTFSNKTCINYIKNNNTPQLFDTLITLQFLRLGSGDDLSFKQCKQIVPSNSTQHCFEIPQLTHDNNSVVAVKLIAPNNF